MLRRAGLAASIVYFLLPIGVIFVLVGFAMSWWVGALLAGGSAVLVSLSYGASRSNGLLGRLLGNGGWDPFDYSQWTRYLVVRPLVESLPVSFAIILAILLAGAFTPSTTGTVAIYAVCLLLGIAAGVALWQWRERKHQQTVSTKAQAGAGRTTR